MHQKAKKKTGNCKLREGNSIILIAWVKVLSGYFIPSINIKSFYSTTEI